MIRLYGHYASQPCWSVCWLLQIHHVDYEFIKIDPSAPHVAKPVEFLSKFPLGLIPAMIDNTGDDDGEEFFQLYHHCSKFRDEIRIGLFGAYDFIKADVVVLILLSVASMHVPCGNNLSSHHLAALVLTIC